MLELGAGADILRTMGWLYIGLTTVLVGAALWFPRRWLQKASGVVVVLLIFTGPAYLRGRESSRFTEERKARFEKAKALFAERCKTAGERIYRTVTNVDGVLLVNIRPDDKAANRENPNWADAALPDEAGGDWYIRSFLSWEHQQFPPKRGYLNSEPSNLNGYLVFPGYAFVDTKGADGIVHRYQFRNPPNNEMKRAPVVDKPARFAVSYQNHMDPTDRAHWIAGTVVTIADTLTNQVLAQKTWYAIEPGQGDISGSRAPWGFAQTCPELAGWRGGSTRMFVDQVLIPTQGERNE